MILPRSWLMSACLTTAGFVWCCAAPEDEASAPDSATADALGAGDYVILSQYSSRAVEVEAYAQHDGARVQQWTPNGGRNQIWSLRDLGGGNYQIRALHSGKCLDLLGWAGEDGAQVGQWTCNGKQNQAWKLVWRSGYVELRSAWNGKCLDDLGWMRHDGADVGVWQCKGAENQRFVLRRSGGNSGTGGSGGTGGGGSASGGTASGGSASGGSASGGSASGGSASGGSAGGSGTGGAGTSPRARVLNYLNQISGKATIAGQHNREPNSDPSKWTRSLHEATGRYPGLWSGDFLFQRDNIDARATMVAEAKRQWAAGSLVNIMYHACPPTQGEACNWDGGVLSHLSDAQWKELLTDGSALNRVWKTRLDAITPYLQDLERSGVAVLFRPLHEMNQGAFWWGGRPGPNGTRQLYRLTHDYLTRVKGLTQLVWVWDVQDLSWDFADYNPGTEYYDVAALDIYGDGYTKRKYDALLSAALGKPIAIGECERLPTAQELRDQPRWVFFMGWAELVQEKNSLEAIRDVYGAANVLTRDELPGWR
jgi:mannan endo-1,4-beta-mannosidase